MAFLGMDPQFKAYNQSPLFEAVGGEVVLPIKVMSPDSILIKNGATLHNPTDWTIESVTNKVSLKVAAKSGDQYSLVNLASFSISDAVSKSAKNQEIISSPKVVDVPTDPKQLGTVGQIGKSDSSKNIIINPNFQVNQRSNIGLTSHLSLTSGGHFSDCWKHVTSIASGGPSVVMTHQRITDSSAIKDFTDGKIPIASYGTIKHTLSTYNPSVRATTAIAQWLEDYGWAEGEDVTFSFYARCPTAATAIGVAVGNIGIDTLDINEKYPLIARVNIGTEWKRFEFTFKMPALLGKTLLANKRLSIEFCLNSINDNTNSVYGTITNSNELHITGIMLEKGTVATGFNPRSLQEETMRCYRYLYCVDRVMLSPDVDISVSYRFANIQYPQCMISTPSITATAVSNSGSKGTAAATSISNVGVIIFVSPGILSYEAGIGVKAENIVLSAEL